MEDLNLQPKTSNMSLFSRKENKSVKGIMATHVENSLATGEKISGKETLLTSQKFDTLTIFDFLESISKRLRTGSNYIKKMYLEIG